MRTLVLLLNGLLFASAHVSAQERDSAVACSTAFLRNRVAAGDITAWDLRVAWLVLKRGWQHVQSHACGPDEIPGVAAASCELYHADRRPVINLILSQFSRVDVATVDLNRETLTLRPGDILWRQFPWATTGDVVVVQRFDAATNTIDFVAWIGAENREFSRRGFALAERTADGNWVSNSMMQALRPVSRAICR